MDLLLRDRLQTPMDNLLAYFQMNKGTTLRWTDVQRILKKDGAQDKDIKTSNLPRIMELFPVFQITDSKGVFIQKGVKLKPPYYVSIPASQENIEGDADDVPVVQEAPPGVAQEEDARGRLRNRIWGRGRIRGPRTIPEEGVIIRFPCGGTCGDRFRRGGRPRGRGASLSERGRTRSRRAARAALP